MKEEIFESVLNEILEELKQSTRAAKDLQNTVTALSEKVAGFDQRLNEQVVAPPADTLAVQKVVEESLARLEQCSVENTERINSALEQTIQKTTAIVEAQPKAVTRQVRFLSIPENDPNGNFKYVVGKVLLWLLAIVIVSMLYVLVSKAMGKW